MLEAKWTASIIFTAVVGHTFMGAYLFYKIEQPHEKEEFESSNRIIKRRRQEFAQMIYNVTKNCGSENCTKQIEEIIHTYDIETGVQAPMTKYNWQNYWNAVWFVTTVYTTIGYGPMAPKTFSGRVLLIAYGLLGIPLSLAMLSVVGKGLKSSMNHIYDVAAKRIFKESDSNLKLKFPGLLVVVLVFLYLFFCGWVMTLVQPGWSYADAVYFYFVSLTTIGFGDLMPRRPAQMLSVFSLLVIGLALLSWLITIFTDSMEQNVGYIGKRIEKKRKNEGERNAEAEEAL